MPHEWDDDRGPTVFIVDDDAAIRRSLRFLIESSGLAVETFETAEAFMAQYAPSRAGCLILDVRMPGMSGLHLQEELSKRGATLPIIIVTGYAEVPMAVRALQAGACDFIEKPFSDQVLLERVRQALVRDVELRRQKAERSEARVRLARLTDREADVLRGVVAGKPNKVIAHDLGLQVKTVEAHRARVMKKLEAESLADLVRLTMLAGWSEEKPAVATG